jgi:hypothetical protein
MTLDITIPMRLGRGMNDRDGHWRARDERVKSERQSVAWMLVGVAKPATPCLVRITRTAPGIGLDDDNLAGACKSVRDEFSKWIGVSDRRSNIVRYTYAQARGKKGEWAVRIEVIEREAVIEELARVFGVPAGMLA